MIPSRSLLVSGGILAATLLAIPSAEASWGVGIKHRQGVFDVSAVQRHGGERGRPEVHGEPSGEAMSFGVAVQKSAGRFVKLGLEAAGGKNDRGGFGFVGPRLDLTLPLGRFDLMVGSGFGLGGGLLPAGTLETDGAEPCNGTYDGAFVYVDPGIGIQLNTRRVAIGLRGSYWHPIVPAPDVETVPGGAPTGFFGLSFELAFGRFGPDRPRPASPRAM